MTDSSGLSVPVSGGGYPLHSFLMVELHVNLV